MRRYDQRNQKKKEIIFSENQKFLTYSLEAPSKQLNFMPSTYPKVPLYYQMTVDQIIAQRRRQDQTIEIQDLINQNATKNEHDNYLQSFRLKQQSRHIPQAINSESTIQFKAGMSILQGNISKMPDFQEPSLKSFQGQEISTIGKQNQNQSTIRAEESILNVIKNLQ